MQKDIILRIMQQPQPQFNSIYNNRSKRKLSPSLLKIPTEAGIGPRPCKMRFTTHLHFTLRRRRRRRRLSLKPSATVTLSLYAKPTLKPTASSN